MGDGGPRPGDRFDAVLATARAQRERELRRFRAGWVLRYVVVALACLVLGPMQLPWFGGHLGVDVVGLAFAVGFLIALGPALGTGTSMVATILLPIAAWRAWRGLRARDLEAFNRSALDGVHGRF